MKSVARLGLLFACLGTPGLLVAQFVDKAASAGVDLNFPTAAGGHSQPGLDPYSVGSASCACDIDGDGWTDLIVTRAGAPCLVFMNNRDGTFREEAALRGLDTVSDIGGIAAGDFQNSGHTDIFMAPVSGSRYYLFANDGTGHFKEVAVERGADATVTEVTHKGQSVSLVDYDRDGYLDVYVSEWQVLSNGQNELHSVLLHNKGRQAPGHFENKTAAAGIVQPVFGNITAVFAGIWADYDGDGYPDLFIVGDFGTSQLWWNNGDGTFTNGTATSGIGNPADGMGVALLDYDGDGKIDIFVSAISLINESSNKGYISDNKLFRNLGGRRFLEVANVTGVKESGWGWGAGALDANNDGLPDLVVTNGFVAPTANFAPARTDPTKLFINQGGSFADESIKYGITDTGLGRSVAILDYDNDGKQDIFITQTEGHRILYHNESSAANAHWLNLRFVGIASNRDGYGTEVTVTAGNRDQTALYNPTNSYIGQGEPRLHFGLGANTTASRIKVKWPSGTVQELTNVTADQTMTVTEGTSVSAAPAIVTEPGNVVADKDTAVVLSVTGQGSPAPVYVWLKDGVKIPGQNSATLKIDHVQPGDAGIYTVSLTNQFGTVTSHGATVTVTADIGSKTVARWWNEALLDAIRKDTPNPPVHARNLYHVSAALWDTFWAYERNGWTAHHEAFVKEAIALPPDEASRAAAQREAMSYAAYTVIKRRYATSPGSIPTTAGIRWLMQQLGYNPDLTDSSGNAPAAVGLRIGQAILNQTLNDGANEANDYRDGTGYSSVNPPLRVRDPGVGSRVDPDHWQPLDLVNTVTQNGIVLGPSIQSFVGSNAKNTQTFALARNPNGFPVDDPGPPPRFGGSTKAEYIKEAKDLVLLSSQLTSADAVTLDIAPGHILNNTLGANDGSGHPINPVTGRPYANNVVLRGDYGRVLAEFWADGPNSETPPGHWNVIFNQVSDHPLSTHQFRGLGNPLRRLEWDVTGYFVLNAALHDAASAAWTLKWEYDSARPITMIRYLAALGQSSDPAQPNYNADGLPLIPGQIELVTAQSSAVGQRHANLAASVGQVAVKSWLGSPSDPTQTSGVGWMLGVNWIPYQRNTFVTPAFPAYISGHSTFSRAAAEVLVRYTGNDYFPGGLATYDFPAGTTLAFEAGPSKAFALQWATYYDAADQAGLSRLYGGIHIAADDFAGRRAGAKVGADAFDRFLLFYYYNNATGSLPTVTQQPLSVATAAGQGAVFRATATSAGVIAYQWQRLAAGETVWTDIKDGGIFSGATTANLNVSAVNVAMSGDLYRVVVTTATGAVATQTATLSVAGAAALEYPAGLVAAADGSLYVVDSSSNTVRRVTGNGQVTTLAGTKGLSGSDDGTGSAARFNLPSAIALDRSGALYVADTGNALIRKVSSTGQVTTLAGSSELRGSQDGTGSAARFNGPSGIAVDRSGDLIVADTLNSTIRRVTANGVVTTIAGTAGVRGMADGAGRAARFNSPGGVAIDAAGNIFVADSFNDTIRKIDLQGNVTTLVGFPGISGAIDGSDQNALFNQPFGLAMDQSGNLLVADSANSTIRRITGAGVVSTVAGVAGVAGLKDGPALQGYFNQPKAVAVDTAGVVYVADAGNAAIRKLLPDGTVMSLSLTETSTDTPSTGSTGTTGGSTGSTGTTPSGGGGGGGGAPSGFFYGLLSALSAIRWLAVRRSRQSA